MISQSEIAKLVIRQNIHKLESQIKETEEYLATLRPKIILLREIDTTAQQNVKNAMAFAKKRSEQMKSSSQKSKNWHRILSAVERAQELVQLAQDNYTKSQQQYNAHEDEYKAHSVALEKLKSEYKKSIALYAALNQHFQNKDSNPTILVEGTQEAFLQTHFSL